MHSVGHLEKTKLDHAGLPSKNLRYGAENSQPNEQCEATGFILKTNTSNGFHIFMQSGALFLFSGEMLGAKTLRYNDENSLPLKKAIGP